MYQKKVRKTFWKSNSRTLFRFVPLHTGGRSQRGQNGRRHRCYDLHNPLKSLFLCHNRLIDLMDILRKKGLTSKSVLDAA